MEFSINDKVKIISSSKYNEIATVIEIQPAQICKLRLKDGTTVFYSFSCLEKINEQA